MSAPVRAIAAAFLAAFTGFVSEVRAQDPVLAAAGDIACGPSDPSYNGGNGTATACRMRYTSDLLTNPGISAVLLLGDNQYENATLDAYLTSYDPTWGRVKAITRPVVGNHEYNTPGAAGYYGYFGTAAGDPAKGWYSFDLGTWHVVALNSNCAAIGGCGAGSPQEQWLRADLAAHPNACTLAAWHHPRFSSGPHGDDATTAAFWDALYDAGADLVLNGHDHIYERFAPQDPHAAADPARGIAAFIVGTGGKNATSINTIRANSLVRNVGTFGVLKLTLHASGYDFQFAPEAGGTFTESGSGICHRTPHPVRFHPVAPCRLVDTRNAPGPSGGPALTAGSTRDFPVASLCGVPGTATSVALNATVASPAAAGSLRLQASGLAPAATSTVSFRAGRTRANNTMAEIGSYGRVAVTLASTGAAHLVLDVVGYFE